MGRAFTHYWNTATWNARVRAGGGPLLHLAGNAFAVRGIASGDRVYVVSVKKGVLHLVGRMEVGLRVDFEYASAVLEETPWEVDDHLLARTCTAMRFDRVVPAETAAALLFLGLDGEVAPKFDAPGVLNDQTLRGVRRLTAASADLLDRVLADDPLITPQLPVPRRVSTGGDGSCDALLAPLGRYLQARGQPYDINDDGNLVVTLEGEGGEGFDVLGMPCGSHITLTLSLPLEVPEARRSDVAEAVARANVHRFVDFFVYYVDVGRLALTGAVLHPAERDGRDGVGALLETMQMRAMVYSEAFGAVIEGRCTPADAVMEAEAFLDDSGEIDEEGEAPPRV